MLLDFIFQSFASLAIDIAKCIYEITQDAYKSTVTTVTGSAAGYAPQLVSNVNGTQMSTTEVCFQYAVWIITITVGLFAIVNAIQKQIDRHRRKKQKIDSNEEEN